jgi:hypothetical protein
MLRQNGPLPAGQVLLLGKTIPAGQLTAIIRLMLDGVAKFQQITPSMVAATM